MSSRGTPRLCYQRNTVQCAMSKAILRAKTGCLTCRKRKVKCGEERPSCRNCSAFGRSCNWPSSADLHDRRHRVFTNQNSSTCRSVVTQSQLRRPPRDSPSPAWDIWIPGDQEDLMHYFFNCWFSFMVLPSTSTTIFNQSQSELVDMMLQCQSVKHAVLACCASNKHMLSNDDRYQRIAFRYYSQAVHELQQKLVRFRPGSERPKSELLTTVIFLYVYDLWSLDTTCDPRSHVAGAMKLLALLSQGEGSPVSMTKGFNRIVVESILYQAFLLATRNPFAPNFHVDEQFIAGAERLLLPGVQDSELLHQVSSPVLGAPTSLYRLQLGIVNFYNASTHQNPIRESLQEQLAVLQCEMEYWEAFVKPPNRSNPPCSSSVSQFDLIILATSLLLNLVTESFISEPSADLPSILKKRPQPFRQQLNSCLRILRQPREFEKWTRCFLSTWPLLILGYTVSLEEDVVLIRHALEQLRRHLGYGEVQRILDELEEVWAAKGIEEAPASSLLVKGKFGI